MLIQNSESSPNLGSRHRKLPRPAGMADKARKGPKQQTQNKCTGPCRKPATPVHSKKACPGPPQARQKGPDRPRAVPGTAQRTQESPTEPSQAPWEPSRTAGPKVETQARLITSVGSRFFGL